MSYGAIISSAGPWVAFVGLCILIVTVMLRGDVVSRKTYEDIIHDRDMWRSAHMISESARQEERDQKKELLEYARTTAAVISALPIPHQGEET